jgi:hypothetical protein
MISEVTQAFPDLIRHGYINCNSCHVSHAGGDLLTPYGKSLNTELISANQSWIYTKPPEKSENPEELSKDFEKPWFQFGLNARALQSFVDNSVSSKARFMIMQVEADFIMSYGDLFDFYFSVGRQESTQADATIKDFFYMPQTWVRYNQNIDMGGDDPLLLQLKWGKFTPSYGIRFQEHTLVVRRDLDFSPGSEKINLELLLQYLDHELVLAQLQKMTFAGKQYREQGHLLRYAYSIGDSNLKVGANIYNSSEKKENSPISNNKNYTGIFLLKGFEERNYLLLEADQKTNQDKTKGYLATIKLGHEIENGLQWFYLQEYENLQIERTDPHIESFGVGVHYFPSPNLNFETLFKKEKNTGVIDEYQNILWIVGHLQF